MEEDILEGVPESEWVRTVKDNLREKFPNGVTVGNNEIRINNQSRREMTFSGYMQQLMRTDRQLFADKLRATNNADEILRASRNWVNEALLHPRNDAIIDFARGEVLLRVGNRDYTAQVIVGNRGGGNLLLYDIVGLEPTAIQERGRKAGTDNITKPQEGTGDRQSAPASEDSIPQNTAERNPRYSFGGRNANRADLEALDRAQDMERRGVAADTIFRETGWFQGADGKWRFEIDDSGMEYSRWGDMNRSDRTEYARFRELEGKFIDGTITQEEQAELRSLLEEGHGPGRAEEQQTLRLSDFVRHDELYQNYPQLRQAGLPLRGSLRTGRDGTYNAETNTITLNNSLRDAPEDTLVHEIQHAIQNAEGFAGRTPARSTGEQRGRQRSSRSIERRSAAARDRLRDVEDRFQADRGTGDTINVRQCHGPGGGRGAPSTGDPAARLEQKRYQDRRFTMEEAARAGGWEDLRSARTRLPGTEERTAALSTGLDARYTP